MTKNQMRHAQSFSKIQINFVAVYFELYHIVYR